MFFILHAKSVNKDKELRLKKSHFDSFKEAEKAANVLRLELESDCVIWIEKFNKIGKFEQEVYRKNAF